jgi:hypothetical protein
MMGIYGILSELGFMRWLGFMGFYDVSFKLCVDMIADTL